MAATRKRADARRAIARDETAGAKPGHILTLRIPEELDTWLRAEAAQRGGSLNGFTVSALQDVRTYFSVQAAVRTALEVERRGMGLSVREYVQHILLRRYEQVATKGPEFDAESVHTGGRFSRDAQGGSRSARSRSDGGSHPR